MAKNKNYWQKEEQKLEEAKVHLFSYNSPVSNARSLSQKVKWHCKKHQCQIPERLEQVANFVKEITFGRTDIDGDELADYLYHRVFVNKVLNNAVISQNAKVLESASFIQKMSEDHTKIGKAVKVGKELEGKGQTIHQWLKWGKEQDILSEEAYQFVCDLLSPIGQLSTTIQPQLTQGE